MCGEKYRREYIEGEKYDNLSMVSGRTVHRAAAARHTKMMRDREETKEEELVEIAREVHDEELERGENSNLNETEKEISKNLDVTLDLVRTFSRDIAPKIKKPLLVEETIEFELFPGLVTRGTIDLVHEDDELCKCLSDLKTSNKKKNQTWIDTSNQLTFYSMLYLNKFNTLPDTIEGHVIVANKNPIVQILFSTRRIYDISSLLKTIEYAVKNISKGNFGPPSDFAWWCAPDQCPHWHRCKYTGGVK
jgi:hypothetical protein